MEIAPLFPMAKRGRPPRYLGTTAAARLIEQELGVNVKPAGLIHHLNRGRLRRAVKSRDPWRLDPVPLLTAYAAEVASRHCGGPTTPPAPARERDRPWRQEARDQVAAITADALQRGAPRPDGANAARLWVELEKARKLQAERIAFTSQYIHRSQVEAAWAQVVPLIEARVTQIADQVAAARPDLPPVVIEAIRRECRDALEAAFGDRLTA